MNLGEQDEYVAAIEEVELEAARLIESVGKVLEALRSAKQERFAGVPLPEIVAGLVETGGRRLRRSADEAFVLYEQAMMNYRVTAIRELVDEYGLSLSEVGRRIGVSRQMVGRLYRSSTE
ncbi:MAG: hypothetical protein QOG16_1638 [Actinomycetota bacterium]|jgi:hypothetical protein|nr:hypothetical protein [Actinomycetota bacterium]MEA2517800.1 hypothetical protein [Actinomycetota bacterium]